MPTFFNFRGYSAPDPLDKAPGAGSYVLLMLVNLVLSVLLLYVITGPAHILHFNGFKICNISFSPWYTMGLEVVFNCFIFSPIINLLRKSSSIAFYLLVLLAYYPLDLYIESHYRHVNPQLALWVYNDSSVVSAIKPAALKFWVTISVDGILFGIVGLYLARLLALLVYKKKSYPAGPTTDQYKNLFRKEWSAEDVSKPKRDAAFYILRILGFSYLAYLLILVLGLMGSLPWPEGIAKLMNMTYANPALAINTYFKITLMIMLTFIAAYNKSLRFYACWALLCGHAVSTIYSLVFHFCGSLHATETDFLLVSAITDGVMIAIFLWIIIKYNKDADVFKPVQSFSMNFSIPMTLVQNLYRALGWGFVALALFIVCVRVFTKGGHGISAVFGNPDPMIGNTVTLYSTLALISFFLIKRDKLRQHFFNTLIVPLIAGSVTALLWLIIGDLNGRVHIVTRLNTTVSVDWYFALFVLLNVIIITLLVSFRKMYYNVDNAINTLSPSAAVNVTAMTGAFFDVDAKQQASILKSVDQYVGGIRGRKRGLMNLPFGLFENLLNFLYGMHPPFSSMQRDEQRYFLHKYFLTDELERKRAFVPALADFANQIGLSLNAIVSFATYSNINVKNDIGYVPVDARDRLQGDIAAFEPPFNKPAPLPKDHLDPNNFKVADTAGQQLVAPRVTTPLNECNLPQEVDYLVIGSGAGGATATYRLACAENIDPSQILLVETGNRYQPMQDFTDNEIEMMKKVYKEGGLQQTKQFTMNMLQGECLGGSTILNNAVCFAMPDDVRDMWQNDYDIDLSRLEEKYKLIEKELGIKELGQRGINQIVKQKFLTAVNGLNAGLPADEQLDMHNPVKVNHLNNIGDGNWNLGNKRMRKRSMLETYIPWSEARGVKVITNMTAVRFTTNQEGIADSVILRADNGELSTVKVRKAIIVAGGAVASSHFLMRSEIKNDNIGKELSCNFAFPMAFEFDEEIKAFDGEQITLGALDPKSRSAFETYFNPPASFSLSVPFFFERRASIMAGYSKMLNFGSLLGAEANGTIQKKADLLNGQAFTWKLGPKDVDNIKYALTSLVKLGKLAGAKRAIVPTKPGIDLDLNDTDIGNFNASITDFPLRITDLALATAHPQGGNFMAGKNSKFKNKRVVNENFQVDGYANVFVADASLFPTSITVNPQWTIMAMSSLAMDSVLNLTHKP